MRWRVTCFDLTFYEITLATLSTIDWRWTNSDQESLAIIQELTVNWTKRTAVRVVRCTQTSGIFWRHSQENLPALHMDWEYMILWFGSWATGRVELLLDIRYSKCDWVLGHIRSARLKYWNVRYYETLKRSFGELRRELWARYLYFGVVMMSLKAIRWDEHIEDMSVERNEKRYNVQKSVDSENTDKRKLSVVSKIEGKQEENAILGAKWWC